MKKSILKENTLPLSQNGRRRVSFAPEVTLHRFPDISAVPPTLASTGISSSSSLNPHKRRKTDGGASFSETELNEIISSSGSNSSLPSLSNDNSIFHSRGDFVNNGDGDDEVQDTEDDNDDDKPLSDSSDEDEVVSTGDNMYFSRTEVEVSHFEFSREGANFELHKLLVMQQMGSNFEGEKKMEEGKEEKDQLLVYEDKNYGNVPEYIPSVIHSLDDDQIESSGGSEAQGVHLNDFPKDPIEDNDVDDIENGIVEMESTESIRKNQSLKLNEEEIMDITEAIQNEKKRETGTVFNEGGDNNDDDVPLTMELTEVVQRPTKRGNNTEQRKNSNVDDVVDDDDHDVDDNNNDEDDDAPLTMEFTEAVKANVPIEKPKLDNLSEDDLSESDFIESPEKVGGGERLLKTQENTNSLKGISGNVDVDGEEMDLTAPTRTRMAMPTDGNNKGIASHQAENNLRDEDGTQTMELTERFQLSPIHVPSNPSAVSSVEPILLTNTLDKLINNQVEVSGSSQEEVERIVKDALIEGLEKKSVEPDDGNNTAEILDPTAILISERENVGGAASSNSTETAQQENDKEDNIGIKATSFLSNTTLELKPADLDHITQNTEFVESGSPSQPAAVAVRAANPAPAAVAVRTANPAPAAVAVRTANPAPAPAPSSPSSSSSSSVLTRFLNDVAVNFYIDPEIETSSNRAVADVSMEIEHPELSQFITCLPLKDFYAQYVYGCEELLQKIADYDAEYEQVIHHVDVEPYTNIQEYYNTNNSNNNVNKFKNDEREASRASLNMLYQTVRDYTIAECRRDWFMWRVSSTQSLIEHLEAQRELLDNDRNLLRGDLELLDKLLEESLRYVNELKVKVSKIMSGQEQIDRFTAEELGIIKQDIRKFKTEVRDMQHLLESKQRTLSEIDLKIKEVENETSKQENELQDLTFQSNRRRIFTRAEKTEIVQLYRFLSKFTFLKYESTSVDNVLQFEFDKSLTITFDFLQNVLGMEVRQNNFHFQQLIECVMTFTLLPQDSRIADRFMHFSKYWCSLRKLDLHFYRISYKNPVSVVVDDGDNNMNNNGNRSKEIRFKVNYFNFKTLERFVVHAPLSVDDVVGYELKMKVWVDFGGLKSQRESDLVQLTKELGFRQDALVKTM